MHTWCLEQFIQLLVRYSIALLVGGVVGSVAHFFIFSTISNSFIAKVMILNLIVLMIPSVLVWHLIVQFSPIMNRYKRYVEIKSASITVVLVLAGIVVWLPELTSAAAIDITLFICTFTFVDGLCGYTMDRLKQRAFL